MGFVIVFHGKAQDLILIGMSMATDVQPLFAGFPPPGQSPVSDGRDRHQATQTFGPSHDFESMLGRAEARQAAPRREASLSAAGLKTGAQSRRAAP